MIEGDSWAGEKIEQSKLEKLSGKPMSLAFYLISTYSYDPTLDEQVQQLYELMQAIKGRNGDDQESS
jgi:hypothetical protein